MRLRFILPLLIALLWPAFALGAFTEFYCNYSTGSNVNAGSTTSGTPALSLTGGDWVSSTGVFTKTGSITGVSVGDFAAVRVDGATVAARIGRVTAVDADTVTISTTAGSGSLANQTATCSICVGGCWKGPNAAVDFPLGVITNAAKNSSGNPVRVNLKNNATYSITASIAPNQVGPITVQGYTTTVGDGGKATIDGGTNAIVLLAPTATADGWNYCDLIFSNNGTTGTNAGVSIPSGCFCDNLIRCKVTTVRGHGLYTAGGGGLVQECEFTACNGSNTFGYAAITLGANSTTLSRCYIHDNTGSNGLGIYIVGGEIMSITDSIIESNGYAGIYWRYGSGLFVSRCDFYNNGNDGIREYHDGSVPMFVIENCNFVKNTGWGLDFNLGTVKSAGIIRNCGFGAGTQANGSGTTSGVDTYCDVAGTVTYPNDVTPWNDPANGDFTITLAAAKGAGRGTFATGLTSTVGYPDIGAAQHQDSGGGGVSRARVVNPRD